MKRQILLLIAALALPFALAGPVRAQTFLSLLEAVPDHFATVELHLSRDGWRQTISGTIRRSGDKERHDLVVDGITRTVLVDYTKKQLIVPLPEFGRAFDLSFTTASTFLSRLSYQPVPVPEAVSVTEVAESQEGGKTMTVFEIHHTGGPEPVTARLFVAKSGAILRLLVFEGGVDETPELEVVVTSFAPGPQPAHLFMPSKKLVRLTPQMASLVGFLRN
ncbi:MAG: hypothetical protein MI755_21745 [Sphingomonadales bacterium]|nr:hypothetical protein [Sphingomonadales bacterium]